ncbi:serine recombinase [Clostridia bacterium]|nr:serine recombinase [Clostridia bacterium]
MPDTAGNYVIYLRKSRADAEAEARGEGETLLKHEKALLALAKRKQIPITDIYREIVSGETIAARPQMQKLLAEVEAGKWAGVLVMEVERLARGDTIDQGTMAQTFKYSNTLIITPNKTYHPQDEFDEEYFEFGLFMSRREYKTINRRLQRGREASARDGRYQGSRPPYGYKKIRSAKNEPTLEIIPEQAQVVRLIFEYYVHGELQEDGSRRRLGIQALARKLNEMGIVPATHDYWQKETLKNILTNPVYIGKIRWGYRKKQTKIVNGMRVNTRPVHHGNEYILADGLHDAIVGEETWNRSQEMWEAQPPAPVGYKNQIKNPMAGLILCGKCGRKMTFRKAPNEKKKDYLVCHCRECDNVSTPIDIVEKRLIEALREWLDNHRLDWSQSGAYVDCHAKTTLLEEAVERLKLERETLDTQLSNAYDLVEQGIYTTEHFLERSQTIQERIEQNTLDFGRLVGELDREKNATYQTEDFIPRMEKIMEVYDTMETAHEKNLLLKDILEKAVYTKERSGAYKGTSVDDFELTIFPKL